MATVPVEITWTTGQIVTAAQLNSNLRDAVNFLLTPPLAVLRQTVAQSLATGTFNPITFDTEDFDRDNGHSTVSNTSRYTAQTPGWYEPEGIFAVAPNATNRRIAKWVVNGTPANAARVDIVTVTQPAGATFSMNAPTRRLFLNTNDYLELYGWQDGAASLNTLVAGEQASYFGIRLVSL